MIDLTDYIGRTYDVMAFAGPQAIGEKLLDQRLFGGNSGEGTICTGIQMLAQRFLLEFLTPQGSMRYLPSRGSRFMQFLREGRIQSEIDAFSVFSFALGDVQSNLLAEESDTDPADERFQGAELLSVTFAPGFLSLKIQVTSRAGDTRKVILPVPYAT